jgi:hypothetical protein
LKVLLDEPLDHHTIRRLSRQILRDGLVEWTTHALDEMEKDDLDELDCRNVIWPERTAGATRTGRAVPGDTDAERRGSGSSSSLNPVSASRRTSLATTSSW